MECHDGRLGLAATACEGLTLEKVFDDFNDDGAGKASLALDFDAARAHSDPPEPRPRSSTYGDAVDRSGAVWNSNLQLDFNVSICDSSDANSSAVLRELDESNRFVQKSAESTSI